MLTIRRMMDHLYWANGQLLAAMDGAAEPDAAVLKLCRHMLVAERVWITRLEGRSSAHLALWENADGLASLRELAQENERLYRRYIEALTEDRLDGRVEYRNQSGVLFRTSVRDIVTHVALHGHYHRGQINRALREQGGSPAGIDYITFVRIDDM